MHQSHLFLCYNFIFACILKTDFKPLEHTLIQLISSRWHKTLRTYHLCHIDHHPTLFSEIGKACFSFLQSMPIFARNNWEPLPIVVNWFVQTIPQRIKLFFFASLVVQKLIIPSIYCFIKLKHSFTSVLNHCINLKCRFKIRLVLEDTSDETNAMMIGKQAAQLSILLRIIGWKKIH